MSRDELAFKAGISTSYVTKLEQNVSSRISLDIYDKLCKALDCEIQDILEYVPD